MWDVCTAGMISFPVAMEGDCNGGLAMRLSLDGSASLPDVASLPSDYLGFAYHSDVEVGVRETKANDAAAVAASDLALEPGAAYRIDFPFRDDCLSILCPRMKDLMRCDGKPPF